MPPATTAWGDDPYQIALFQRRSIGHGGDVPFVRVRVDNHAPGLSGKTAIHAKGRLAAVVQPDAKLGLIRQNAHIADNAAPAAPAPGTAGIAVVREGLNLDTEFPR